MPGTDVVEENNMLIQSLLFRPEKKQPTIGLRREQDGNGGRTSTVGTDDEDGLVRVIRVRSSPFRFSPDSPRQAKQSVSACLDLLIIILVHSALILVISQTTIFS